MTIHFAAARTPNCSPVARALARSERTAAPANDNGNQAPGEEIFKASLRHFAEHGLGAARAARAQAQQAFFAGDRQAYDWWLSITRTLDRRLAAELDQQDSETQGASELNPVA